LLHWPVPNSLFSDVVAGFEQLRAAGKIRCRSPRSRTSGAPGTAPNATGSLGDLLKGVLGDGAAGTALSGGLNDLLKQLQQSGQGDVAKSWVGAGENKAISPKDLASALGADRINSLMAYSGMSREGHAEWT
jgi:uncharacterized protein YidB (DUF937 family)